MSLSQLATLPQDQAKALIKQIVKDNGLLSEQDHAAMQPEIRQTPQKATLDNNNIGDAIRKVVTNTTQFTNTQFIYELLQNADSNRFTWTTAMGRVPYLAFHVHQDKIIVESNEDGFTEADLRALCTIGKISDQGERGKGVGFKSVFRVVSRASIQFGAFSFYFQHRSDELGLGMIAPEWYSPDSPTNPEMGTTRMTFALSDNVMQQQEVFEELRNLRPAMLLFMRQLRRIKVCFYDDAGKKEFDTTMSLTWLEPSSRARITTLRSRAGDPKPTQLSQLYHVTEGIASGLAKSEKRLYSEEEMASRIYSQAKVVLAFPLDTQSMPAVESQEIFAIHPILSCGYNFLIHSDFVTTADNQGFLPDSQRNKDLHQYLVKTFVSAAKQMCNYPELRFRWIRYLPRPVQADEFSMLLRQEIANANIMVPLLSTGPLLPLTQLKEFPRQPSCLDHNNRPIFSDLPGEKAIYLSFDYHERDRVRLREYGLMSLSMQDIVATAEADLQSSSSKLKNPETDKAWHTLAAGILLEGLESGSEEIRNWIKYLPILPLADGRWITANNGPVYFATTAADVLIPNVLGLKCVNADASAHPDRNALFRALGVASAPPWAIWTAIWTQYSRNKSLTLGDSVALLRCLYLTCLDQGLPDKRHLLTVKSATEQDCHPDDLYLADDSGPFSPARLGLDVDHLHQDYLRDPPQRWDDGNCGTMTWGTWLHQEIGIRRELRLACRRGLDNGLALSDEILHIAKHKPGQLVALLRHLWGSQGIGITADRRACAQLRNLGVLCEGEATLTLEGTILPTPRLKSLSRQFLEPEHSFPFLQLDADITNETEGSWRFLDCLGVIADEDIGFYVALLEALSEKTIEDPSRVLRLYAVIENICAEAGDPAQIRQHLRNYYKGEAVIYVPKQTDREPRWCCLEECLLDAPASTRHKYPIDLMYSEAFAGDSTVDLPTVQNFLRHTLAVDACCWEDHIAELRYLKDQGCLELPEAVERYQSLWTLAREPTEHGLELQWNLQTLFESEALILYPTGLLGSSWHRTTDCVWSTTTILPAKPNLQHLYPDFHGFFVDILSVSLPDARAAYNELLSLPYKNLSVAEAKAHLLAFDSLLRSTSEQLLHELPPRKLLEKPVVPIRYGDGRTELVPASTEFAIVDLEGLPDDLPTEMKMLDFEREALPKIERFLEWSGLTERYISSVSQDLPFTNPGERTPISSRDFDIKRKVHALLRVAKHFGSPKYEGDGMALFSILSTAKMWECDDISAWLTLTMNNNKFVVQLDKGGVHIGQGERNLLEIYVPQDEVDRDVCLQYQLPRQLAKWLMSRSDADSTAPVNEKMVSVLKGILNAKVKSLPRLLQREGIPEVSLPNPSFISSDEEDIIPTIKGIKRVLFKPPKGPEPTTSSTPLAPPAHKSAGYHAQNNGLLTPSTVQRIEERSPSGTLGPPRALFLTPQTGSASREADFAVNQGSHSEQYQNLLSRMIWAGQNIRFPEHKHPDTLPLHMRLPPHLRSRGPNRFTNLQIGAAGELFVVELLRALQLPEFSIEENWTSNIRDNIRDHPAYSSLTQWKQGAREITDIQYRDRDKKLTSFLEARGYGHLIAKANDNLDEPLTYYIEVKSTPGGLDTAVRMGLEQHETMTKLCIEANSVYVIFRVFDMFTDKIDFRLYVNPTRLQSNGVLKFENKWLMTPTKR
ncbi:hypothetical protein QBC41DRAFT_132417 [Cercophora samala]|uniref:Protein NO VEIN C-terminal domain-containing protein n=1 Tax=Cercophora samala TaxID=330535 RepID=A0AA39ZCA4_9PEZI|nr:hypothetical protein QBC41DRAFT_132417 [Cercophora samala]